MTFVYLKSASILPGDELLWLEGPQLAYDIFILTKYSTLTSDNPETRPLHHQKWRTRFPWRSTGIDGVKPLLARRNLGEARQPTGKFHYQISWARGEKLKLVLVARTFSRRHL